MPMTGALVSLFYVLVATLGGMSALVMFQAMGRVS